MLSTNQIFPIVVVIVKKKDIRYDVVANPFQNTGEMRFVFLLPPYCLRLSQLIITHLFFQTLRKRGQDYRSFVYRNGFEAKSIAPR